MLYESSNEEKVGDLARCTGRFIVVTFVYSAVVLLVLNTYDRKAVNETITNRSVVVTSV